MATPTSLIDLILSLLRNPAEMQAFQQDPQSFLAACGASDVSPADVHDALVLAQDDDNREHHHSGGGHHHVPPPPAPQPGETEHEAAIRYINTYVTNNYVDARQTTVDNSIHQHVDTHGGDFDQNIDIHSTTASGDGAVAAGGSITGSTVTTGNDNQVGTGNVRGDGNVQGNGNDVVNGHDNTTAFGTGAANNANIDHVNVGDGGALAVGGNAAASDTSTDSHNVATNTTTNTTDVDHSYNTDAHYDSNSHNTATSDTHTDSHDTTHTDTLSHNAVDFHA